MPLKLMIAKNYIVGLAVSALALLCYAWFGRDQTSREVDGLWVSDTVEQLLNDPDSAEGNVRDTIWNDFRTLHDERVRYGKFTPASVSTAEKGSGSSASYRFDISVGHSKIKGAASVRYVDGTPQISTIRFYPGLNTIR